MTRPILSETPEPDLDRRLTRLGWLHFAIGIAWLASAFGPAPLDGQVLPIGEDYQVNIATAGRQLEPFVAALPSGGFVVAWTDLGADYSSIVSGRRFDASGAPVGGEFEIGPFESRRASGIGADGNGDFVVVWGEAYSGPGGGDPDDVHARRFEADASPSGDPFVVNSSQAFEYLGHARVAMHSSGSFVVSWENYGSFARQFDSEGEPLGDDFALPVGFERPEIASRPAGGFVVAAQSVSTSPLARAGCSNELLALRYSVAGEPIGDPIPVYSEPTCIRKDVDIDASGTGSFALVWTGLDTQGEGGIFVRRFAATGTPQGPALRVSERTLLGTNRDPRVRFQPGGGFVVVWTGIDSSGSDQSENSIQARRYAADGTPLGQQFQVNSFTWNVQELPAVAFDAPDRLVVAWESSESGGTDASDSSIQLRRFQLPFFTDGFENGTTSRWSVAQAASRSLSN